VINVMHPAISCFAQLHAAMRRLQLCRETSEAERRRRGKIYPASSRAGCPGKWRRCCDDSGETALWSSHPRSGGLHDRSGGLYARPSALSPGAL